MKMQIRRYEFLGVDRDGFPEIEPSETGDFVKFDECLELLSLSPLRDQLTEVGRRLVAENKINPKVGDSLAVCAAKYLLDLDHASRGSNGN